MGLPVGAHYAAQANARLAANLEGRLFLIHGDMDENVHISSTLVLVDALVAANKDFDLLILPNRSHGIQDDPYVAARPLGLLRASPSRTDTPALPDQGPGRHNAG